MAQNSSSLLAALQGRGKIMEKIEKCSLETNFHCVLLWCAGNDCYEAVCFAAKFDLLKVEELNLEKKEGFVSCTMNMIT